MRHNLIEQENTCGSQERDIAIYGAGGLGREIACLLQRINFAKKTWNLIGFFDDKISIGTDIGYGKILGGKKELNTWPKILAVVVAIGNAEVVKEIIQSISNPLISYPNIIAPDLICLDRNTFNIGKGNIICSRCLISCNVSIGDFNIFNGYIGVGHDAQIGSYNVFMPAVNISGGVVIGDCNFFGVQSVVLQYLNVGNNVRLGANSVLIRKTEDGNLYMGNPAVKVKF